MVRRISSRTPFLAIILLLFGLGYSFAANKVVVLPLGDSDENWLVSVPVSQSYWHQDGSSPSWEIASGASKGPGGLRLNSGSYGRFWNGFTLPNAYKPGTSVHLRITWAADTDAINCTYLLELNWATATRKGVAQQFPSAQFEVPFGAGFPATRLSPPTNKSIIQETYLEFDGGKLMPGDHVQFALNRDPSDGNDTCDEPLYLTGMTAEPG